MDILTVDFETYYDREYSLSKMQTDAYVLDPRFEVIGVCVAVNDQAPLWFSGTMRDTHDWLHQNFHWANAAVRCHNTLFDGCILSARFGVKPKLWMDTLAQARMLRPWLVSHSLANLAKHFKLDDKGTAVHDALGKRREDFNPTGLADYAAYCIHDTHLCREIGKHLDPFTPALNARLIDMTVRMFTEPAFVGDVAKMRELYATEIKRKEELLALATTNRDVIMSNDKFAEALEKLHVLPPKKISKTTGKETYAFAKSDKEFTDLLEHEDSEVQALVAARLGVKTTIAETRAQRFVQMAERGPLAVYLNYWGAKTTGRYSGGNQVNWQNLPARGPSAGLRKALLAPPGYKVMAGDSSNIELRVVMAVAGQYDVLDKLRNGVDLYCDFASQLFGRPITKADKAERQLGKVAMLSLQYGAGAERFCDMVRLTARSDPSLKPISLDRAQEIVQLYRGVHHKVAKLWNYCQDVVLPDIGDGCNMIPVDVHGWTITQYSGFGRPGEPGMVYHNLRYVDREWVYDMGKSTVRIYGPKVVENLCIDGAARVLTDKGWMRLSDITTERVHDGVEFVTHGGTIYKGVKSTVEVDGVRMTPDHEVLTDDGWQAASQVQRPYRPDIRSVDSSAAGWVSQREMDVEFSLYVWEREGCDWAYGGAGAEAGRVPELRLYDARADLEEEHGSRYEQAPGIRCVSQHDRPLSATIASGMGQLRRAWHQCVRAVAGGILGVLDRYGPDVRSWTDTGSCGQQWPVFAGELSVGAIQGAGQQSSRAAGGEPVRSESGMRRSAINPAVPLEQGVAGGGAGSAAGPQEVQTEVWDILNCGPRNRFVILGADGPFIVHNCQHLAMQVVMWQTARINERYPVKLSVHDEAVIVIPEDEVTAAQAYMEECLSMAPKWCRDVLPVSCEVSAGASYGECK